MHEGGEGRTSPKLLVKISPSGRKMGNLYLSTQYIFYRYLNLCSC